MVNRPMTPEEREAFKAECYQLGKGPKKPDSPLWCLVAPSIVVAWVVVMCCVVVSAVAGTVWLVRQAFGV